jgi:hypothetical protein
MMTRAEYEVIKNSFKRAIDWASQNRIDTN